MILQLFLSQIMETSRLLKNEYRNMKINNNYLGEFRYNFFMLKKLIHNLLKLN